jgi:YD repeat-containing protein
VPDPLHVGFQIGAYNHNLPLIIDPFLTYSTYLGGSGDDKGNAIAIDSSGNAYITGTTNSKNFPTTAGSYQQSSAGNYDAFVTKLDGTGSNLVYSTYLGGSDDDEAFGIALDNARNPYITGWTTSSTDYPTTPNAFQRFGAGRNGFVSKLNSDGSTLVYSTLIAPNSLNGSTFAIAVQSGYAFVTGQNGYATPGAYVGPSGSTAFVTKLNLDGSALVYSSIFGGNEGRGIAVDNSGNAYITGDTASSNLRTTNGAFQTTFGGGSTDAFLTKVNYSGSDILYSTYLGGSSDDYGQGIAVNPSSEIAVITGYTFSNNYPTFNPFQPNGGDAFVTKIDTSAPNVIYSTYLGGLSFENGRGIALDPTGNAYVTGFSSSANFPILNPLFGQIFSSSAFVAKLNPAGSALSFSTPFGSLTSAAAIAADNSGNVFVTGQVYYSGTIPTVNAFQTEYAGGNSDTFVAKLTTREIYNNSESPFGDLGDPQDTGGSTAGVYLNDGEYHLRQVDLEIPGRGLNWQFARAYRSGADFETPLGHNWDFNYDRRLWIARDPNLTDIQLSFPNAHVGDVVRIDGAGRADWYARNGDGSYTAPNGFFTRLVNNANGTFTERHASGLVINYLKPPSSDFAFMSSMVDRNGNTIRFDHQLYLYSHQTTGQNNLRTLNDTTQNWSTNQWAGQSIKITSGAAAGQVKNIVSNTINQLTVDSDWNPIPEIYSGYTIFTPNTGPLVRATDTLGRAVDYLYDANGRLQQVRDFYNRSLTFQVDNRIDLRQVTSPVVMGTPTGNDFPSGKTTSYAYSFGSPDYRLNHNLTSIIAPNEFSSRYPRVTVGYYNNPPLNDINKVYTQTIGGTNSFGVPAGGTITYSYPSLPADHHPDAVSETDVTNRNGNIRKYQFDIRGDIVRKRENTPAQNPRSNQPPYFETDSWFNSDYLLVKKTLPEDVSLVSQCNTADNACDIVNAYDSGNSDRFQQGNLKFSTRNPQTARGGDQTAITVNYTYEPIYNQLRTITDPRGTDTAYRPPIQLVGEQYPNANRYTTVNTFDYQKGHDYVGLGQVLGISAAAVQTLLQNANVPMDLGDINGDGTFQLNGNVIRVLKPTVNLLPGSNQAAIEQATTQPTTTLNQFNSFGLITKTIDPEGNVNQFSYYPVQTPGSGTPDPANGGYLAQTAADTTTNPVRDNRTNPTPANILNKFNYDLVGNITQQTDGRGIVTNYAVNQLNQVVQTVRAAAHTTNPAEPLTPVDFQYLQRNFYDGNNNLVLTQVEDRGNTSNVSGDPPVADVLPSYVSYSGTATDPSPNDQTLIDSRQNWGGDHRLVNLSVQITSGTGAGQVRRIADNVGSTLTVTSAWITRPNNTSNYAIFTLPTPPQPSTAFVSAVTKFDILDEPIETVSEVSNIKYLRTRQRYDANQNPIMAIYPAGNASASIYDERDLLFQSIKGANARPTAGLFGPNDPINPADFNRPGGANTVPSIFTYNYDKNGNLIESVDAELNGAPNSGSQIAGVGDVTKTLYDGFDRPRLVTDPLGNRTINVYDPASNVVRTIQSGDPVSNTIPANNTHNTLAVTENIYDELSRPIANHQVLFQTPYPAGQGPARTPTLSVNPAMAAFAPYLADAPSNQAGIPSVIFPPPIGTLNFNDVNILGRVSTFNEYDRNSRPTFSIAANLGTSRTDYDGAGRAVKAIDCALSNGAQIFPTGYNGVVSSAGSNTLVHSPPDWNPNQWQNGFVVIRSGGGAGQVRQIVLNTPDTLTVAPNWTTTPMLNDQFSILPVSFNPSLIAGNVLQTAYDGNSNTIETLQTDYTSIPSVNPESFISTNFYDSLNRLQTTVDNLGQATDFRYDSRGNLVARADANGPLNSRSINRRGLGPTNPVTINDFGNVTLNYFDGINRQLETDTLLTANNLGDGAHIGASIYGVKSDNNYPESFPPAVDGTQAGDGRVTTYSAYDDNSQLLAQRDDNGNVTAYIFDNQDRTLVERKGISLTTTDSFTITIGDSGSFTPFRVGASVDTSEPPTDIATTYDRDSNIQTVTNEGDGSPTPIRSLLRYIEEQQQIGAALPKPVSWSYSISASSSDDNPSAELYPDGRQVNSNFDSLDRLVSRNDNGFAPIGTVQYIGPGPVATRTYKNNVRLTYIGQSGGNNADVGYDRNQRVVKQVWEQFATGTPLGSGNLLVGFGHQSTDGTPAYDRANNVLVSEKLHNPGVQGDPTRPGNSEVYAYRNNYELTNMQRGTLNPTRTGIGTRTATVGALQNQTWTLDGLGNWSQNVHTEAGVQNTENRSHTLFNAIKFVTGSPYGGGQAATYATDGDGNILNDSQRIYKYDALNRLHKVFKTVAGQPVQIAEYLYDADGRRVESVVTSGGLDGTAPNGTTTFWYSGWNAVEERNASDALQQQYVFGDGPNEVWTLDNRRGGITITDLNDNQSDDKRLFYLADEQGSVYGLANKGAVLREGYQYDAYGRQTVFQASNPMGPVVFGPSEIAVVGGYSQLNNPLLYAGYRLDRETAIW